MYITFLSGKTLNLCQSIALIFSLLLWLFDPSNKKGVVHLGFTTCFVPEQKPNEVKEKFKMIFEKLASHKRVIISFTAATLHTVCFGLISRHIQ